ncbi:hypothetical protein [Candidatus Enterococcus ferrettii]|uniref:Transcriptional regulator n=1 Tax=Candidatus Enterococcus ferrettii TaxID=2815324 RepID=A0ABV0EWD1_9ENTE
MKKYDWLLKDKVLREEVLSEDWVHICEAASPLNYYDLGEITALMSMPCDLGTLVVKDFGLFYAEEKPLDVLEKWLTIHRYVNAELKPSSSGTVSLVTSTFCLSAIPHSEGVLWVNPLHIYQLYCGNEGVLVELTNGLSLDMAIDCKFFLRLSVETACTFTLYRSVNQNLVETLRLLDTPFNQYLRKQLDLIDSLLSQKDSTLVKKFLVFPQHPPFQDFMKNKFVPPSPCLATA